MLKREAVIFFPLIFNTFAGCSSVKSVVEKSSSGKALIEAPVEGI